MKPSVAAIALGLCVLSAAPSAAVRPGDASIGSVLAKGVGYPVLVRLAHQADPLADGRVLLAFERDGMGGIPLYVREPGQRDWRFTENVTDQAHGGDATWQLRWQPNLYELPRASGPLPAGTVLLAANATGNDAQGRVVTEDLQLYASDDGGHSWRYLSSIIKGGGKPEDKDNHGVWEPNLRVLDDGRLVAWYSSEQHKAEGYNQLLAHKVSSDGGRTWSAEHVDVAIPGGVERPGMAVVERLPDGRYVMSYEDIDGPQNGHVYLKSSRDGLDWGDPADRGTPVQTQAGAWPAASPIVKWLPLGGRDGVIAVLAERAGGGGDPGGRAIYWNNDLGRGPWWEAPAPVQKLTGNIHAGWTQALLLQKDGTLLHLTSSSVPGAPADARANVILEASAPARFDRYEAEDAARHWAVQIDDPTTSDRRKARVAAPPLGRLDFAVHSAADGPRVLRVRWQDLGFATGPVLHIDGRAIAAGDTRDDRDGWRITTFRAPLRAGDHTIAVGGSAHALDIDYLQIDAAGAPASGD
ncbi:sialidase family protein [Rhodanobacter geophilus]|uniref:Sialidase family protein n=1 Tax=Rhodanobacter geophilus TaxID=3162488 RepID=A0ABV3QPS6_9GAMM